MSTRQIDSLNSNVRGLRQSTTLAIKCRCEELKRDGHTVYDFGLGQSPFPVPTPVVEALRAAAHQKDYLPVRGLPRLREAVAEYHRRGDLLDAQAAGVIIGPGSKELMFLLQLVYNGEILVPTPCWVSYIPQGRIIGRKVNVIPTSPKEQWKLTPDRLSRAVKVVHGDRTPPLLILNYPANPTGATYTPGELEGIVEVARRHGMIVLSDEIYGRLHHTGRHVSLGRYYPEGTIISSGLSKWCGAGGWRLGTFVFPPQLDWLADAVAAVASETYTSVSAPIQHAAIRAFEGGGFIDQYLRHIRRILSMLARKGSEILSGAGIQTQLPAGGYYLFLDFSPLRDQLAEGGIRDDTTLCDRLLQEADVAILPGSAFGRSADELTARLAYVDFHGARALAASEETPLEGRLPEDFANRFCQRVIRGVGKIAQWAHTEQRPLDLPRVEVKARRGSRDLTPTTPASKVGHTAVTAPAR